METLKNKFSLIFAIVFVVVAAVWFLNSDLEHIEDKNGPDDDSLTTITDENIIKMDMGALGGPNYKKGMLTGDTIEISAEKFTGVYEILYDNFIGTSDFVLNITSFDIQEGNFEMTVVHDDKIVARLEPGMFVDYLLEDVKGNVSLRIAGESAAFNFYMSEYDFDLHSHADFK